MCCALPGRGAGRGWILGALVMSAPLSSDAATVDVERGSLLGDGDPSSSSFELTREQKLQIYRDGFIVLRNVIDKKLTSAARKLLEEAEGDLHPGRADVGSQPEITNLINESKFSPLLKSLVGDFDAPVGTHVGVLPVADSKAREHSVLPFYDAFIHMDGLTTSLYQHGDPELPHSSLFGTESPEDLELFQKHYMKYIQGHSMNKIPGRHAENIGVNGGMMFQDPDLSLTTGSFTLFAVACLNDQSEVGRGQFSVLRGCHHAMEKFYQMQIEEGGIVGPEGPGWPRISPMVPVAVREHFLDDNAQPARDEAGGVTKGELFPQPTQCVMEEGDVAITMHAIPHSGSRNEGTEPRLNMIWRIRSKLRQPNFYHDGMTDHPDRNGNASVQPHMNIKGYNGEWMEFEQEEEEPFYPGEVGNDPFDRSKYALSHIWQEWPGMAGIVAEMKAKEDEVRADKTKRLPFIGSFLPSRFPCGCPEPVLANHRARLTRNLILKDTRVRRVCCVLFSFSSFSVPTVYVCMYVCRGRFPILKERIQVLSRSTPRTHGAIPHSSFP
jgi:hypothetical protein